MRRAEIPEAERQGWNDETVREAKSAVRQMVADWSWQEVARGSLRRRMRMLEKTLALAFGRDIEGVRFIQGQHAILRELLENPVDVLADFGSMPEEGG